jgi:hypothetical protein
MRKTETSFMSIFIMKIRKRIETTELCYSAKLNSFGVAQNFKTILVFSSVKLRVLRGFIYWFFPRRFLYLPCLFFSLSVLQAQSLNGEKPTDSYIFPLALVLEWAGYAVERWMPDWPLEIPPDAFKVPKGEISSCEIVCDDFTLRNKIDEAGRAEIFPFMLNGEIAQAALVYNELSELQEMAITFPSGDDPWELEFLEYRNTFPYLVRACCGDGTSDAGLWYFIYFSWGVSEILETWYDENGKAVGIYGFALTEVGRKTRIRAVKDYSAPTSTDSDTGLFYDSRGLVSGISGPSGFFNVLYFREESPRYWERRPTEDSAAEDSAAGNNLVTAGNFTLQWDDMGFLRRLSGEDGNGQLLDCRYEYTLDETGNWIERRETRKIRDMGFLVPAPGTTLRRVLEYKK